MFLYEDFNCINENFTELRLPIHNQETQGQRGIEPRIKCQMSFNKYKV